MGAKIHLKLQKAKGPNIEGNHVSFCMHGLSLFFSKLVPLSVDCAWNIYDKPANYQRPMYDSHDMQDVELSRGDIICWLDC